MRPLIFVLALVVGVTVGCCIDRNELREQHCASVAIARHGWHRPTGVYSTVVRGDRCFARLYDGTITREGTLDDDWRPE